MTWCPWSVNSQTCPHWASSNSSITIQTSSLGTGSHGRFCLRVSTPVSCDSLYLLSVTPILGTVVCLVSPPLCRSKKSYWFFHLFSPLLVVRTEWWLPSSSYAEPETRRTCHLFSFLYSLFLFFLFFLLDLYLIPTIGIRGYYLILPLLSHAQLVSEPCMTGTLGTLYYNIVNVTETPLR